MPDDLDWITKHRCPYCGEGWLLRWEWWLECSKCNRATLEECAPRSDESKPTK